MRPGLVDASGELGDRLVELALVLQHLSATDAGAEQLLPVSRETRLAHGLVGDHQRLVEPVEQAQQHGLLVEGAQAAKAAEFVEAQAGGAKVDALAQGGRIVSEDDAQWFSSRSVDWCPDYPGCLNDCAGTSGTSISLSSPAAGCPARRCCW